MPVLIAVRNGGITEDAQIIEDQMQLFVQTAFPDNYQGWAYQEMKDVLEAIEATEVLSSWEDPQAANWPEHVTTQEEVSEEVPQVTGPSEVETESEDSEDIMEASPSMEKDADADSAMVDVSPEDEELDGASQGEPATEFALAEQAEVFVEAVTAVSAEVEASPEVLIPSDNTGDSEPAEAPVIQDETSEAKTETTPEVAAPMEIPIASAAQAEFFEPGEVTLAPFSEDSATCEASGLSETALLSEATVLDEDAALIEAEAPEEPLEPCEATASCETAAPSEYDTVAPDEFALPDESSALAESPVNLEATEPAVDTETAVEATPELSPSFPVKDETQDDIHYSDEEEMEQSATSAETAQPAETPCFTEPSSAPAPEAEHAAAELDQVEEVLGSPPKASQSSSEVDPEAPAETMSLAESAAAPGEAPEVGSLPADFSTVSIFR